MNKISRVPRGQDGDPRSNHTPRANIDRGRVIERAPLADVCIVMDFQIVPICTCEWCFNLKPIAEKPFPDILRHDSDRRVFGWIDYLDQQFVQGFLA